MRVYGLLALAFVLLVLLAAGAPPWLLLLVGVFCGAGVLDAPRGFD